MNARKLLGKPVIDLYGRPLGTVEELVVDEVSGRVAFAVVALNDDSKAPDPYLPVPWSALVADSNDRGLRLPITAGRVAEAPTIQPDGLDALERRDVSVDVFSYYGLQPPWEGAHRQGAEMESARRNAPDQRPTPEKPTCFDSSYE